jgi:hypothetical protein
MGEMTFHEAVACLRAFHARCRAAAWETPEGEAVEAAAERSLVHLEGMLRDTAVVSPAIHMSFSHSTDDGSRNGTRSSVLAFAGEDELLRFVERAWRPIISANDEHLVPHDCLEYGGAETMNDFNFRAGTMWRTVAGEKVSVPGLSERVDEVKRAKQRFADTLIRRRQMLEQIGDARREFARLRQAVADEEAFLAEHREHLNAGGEIAFEHRRDVAIAAQDRAWERVESLATQLPKIAHGYPGFTIYDADLEASGPDVFSRESDASDASDDAKGGP